MRAIDPLYNIFEQHLFTALVENENTDEFLTRVVQDYITRLTSKGTVIPREHLPSIEGDLRDEVLEMLRKRTYGHYNLNEFRKSHSGAPSGVGAAGSGSTPSEVQTRNARRSKRAC